MVQMPSALAVHPRHTWPAQVARAYARRVPAKVCWNARYEVLAVYTQSAVTLSKWNGESRVTIASDPSSPPSIYYPTQDGFEIETWLMQPPKSNVFRWWIGASNARAHHQPHTTRPGVRRADDVRGSYAIYHPSAHGDFSGCGGQNYRSGKILQVYRPWALDAAGWRVWADLRIEHGWLTVTVPAAFLRQAQYPVVVDPTFGYVTHGLLFDNNASLPMYIYAHTTPASNGTITGITHYHVAAGTANFDTSVYSNNAGAPNSRLAQTQPGTTNNGTPSSEVTTPLTLSITAGVQYWLGMLFIASSPDYAFDALHDNSNNGFKWDNTSTTTWPATADSAGTGADEGVSIYATFTASGATPTDWLEQLPDQHRAHTQIVVVPSGPMPGKGLA